MRIFPRLAVLAAVLALAGCDGDSSTGPRRREISGTLSGDLTGFAPAERCGSSAVLLSVALTGTVLPIGTGSSATLSHCIDPARNVTDGRFTLSGPDGRMSGTYALQLGPQSGTTVPLAGTFTVTEGVGQYAGATGTGSITGQQDAITGAATVTLQGTVRY